MMTKTTGNALRLLLTALLCGGLIACGGATTPPEEALRAWVAEAQQRAEEKDRRGMMALISPSYSDARGNKRDDVENMLRAYFLRQNNIKLLSKIDAVRIFGEDAAELDLTVGMAGTNDGVLGFSADAYSFKMELVRASDDWLLLAARWGEVGGEIH